MKKKSPTPSRFAALLLLGATTFTSPGCVSVVPYAPNTTLVDARGFPEIHRTASEVLNRALDPHITTVDITEAYLQYGWTGTYVGPFWNPITTSHESRIYFANVARVELYANHNVFVWGPQDQRVDKILFATSEDACLFLDCLMSLRATRKPAG